MIFTPARSWSNKELKKFGHLFKGKIINISGWKDLDKEGRRYRKYFKNASEYFISNIKGDRGWSGMPNEIYLDLEKELPAELINQFDVVFCHTVLEHVFDIKKAFDNLCQLSKDIIIIVVPYLQVEHPEGNFGDYWRFMSLSVTENFKKRGWQVLYLSMTPNIVGSIYIFAIASKNPQKWPQIKQMQEYPKAEGMMGIWKILKEDPLKILLNPKKALKRGWQFYADFLVSSLERKLKFRRLSWQISEDSPEFKKRIYRDYQDYLRHQKSALDYKDLSEYDAKYRIVLRERLSDIELLKGSRVICLGARKGTEVRVFWDLDCFAFGVDINPGKNNPYVSYGDFHNLQFPSNSADIVFTNSLDHVFNIDTVISEIKRVLKPNGLLIMEVVKGDAERKSPSFWESFWWERIDDLVSFFEKNQFKIIRRKEFDYPWEGEQIILGYLKNAK